MDQWWVTNTTSDEICVGDLKFLPTIAPGKRVNLLQHHKHDDIILSEALPTLLASGQLTLEKIEDSYTWSS